MQFSDQMKEHDKWAKDEESQNTFTFICNQIRKAHNVAEAYEVCGVRRKGE